LHLIYFAKNWGGWAVFRVSGFQGFRVSAFQRFRVSAFQALGNLEANIEERKWILLSVATIVILAKAGI